MKKDVSIHFTIKGQTVAELDKKIQDFIDANRDNLPFDFSESTEPRSILHHCFLPESTVKEKGFSNEVYEVILHSLCEIKICWFGTSQLGMEWDRRLMLENLKKLGGVAVFVGDIKEGVKDEYDIAKELGIDIIEIP